MIDPERYPLAYCTNVHYTPNAAALLENLSRFATPVREAVDGERPLGVGLWFSDVVVREFQDRGRLAELCQRLAESRLIAYTFNAFPQTNFHQPIVKHAVYRPDWTTDARVEYTLAVAEVVDQLLPAGSEGSISTLPLGWGSKSDPEFWQACRANLLRIARAFAHRESQSGRLLYLCLEPEPGCALSTIADAVTLFAEHLLIGPERELLQRYVRVCYDVCHAAVMFESQAEALGGMVSAGVGIGKVQISSAVEASWSQGCSAERGAILDALAAFDEPRYLHQTSARRAPGMPGDFWEDLVLARPQLAAWEQAIVRVHFHVPIFAAHLGVLHTTQAEIDAFLAAVAQLPAAQRPAHYEVETYAWTVLPDAHRSHSLVAGIAHELRWLSERLNRLNNGLA